MMKVFDTSISKKTVPLGAARKLALEKAKGEWLAFLDTDDLWYLEKLEKQINAVDGTDYVLCYAGIRDISSEGDKIREIIPKYSSGWQLEAQLRQFDINMVKPLINRKTLDVFNLSFDENIVASEEYNLFIRLATRGKFYTIPEVLGSWWIAEDTLANRSEEFWSKDRIYTINQLKKKNPGIVNLYGDTIQEAYSRAIYYKARWLMMEKRYSEARHALKTIAKDSTVYLVLYFISFSKRFWFVVHGDKS
jgi:glycosyltransferase involved in cell wall biosynthesis